MYVFPENSKGNTTYSLVPLHEPSAAPLKKPVSRGTMGSREERRICVIDAMPSSSLLEQTQEGDD